MRELKSTDQRANMRLQLNLCRAMAIGVAADMETNEIHERGAFLHSIVMTNDRTRKKTKNRNEFPRITAAAIIITPRKNAIIVVFLSFVLKLGTDFLCTVFELFFMVT